MVTKLKPYAGYLLLIVLSVLSFGVLAQTGDVLPDVVKDIAVDMTLVSAAIGSFGGYLRTTGMQNEKIPIVMVPIGILFYVLLAWDWSAGFSGVPGFYHWLIALNSSAAANGIVATANNTLRVVNSEKVVTIPKDQMPSPGSK